MFLEPLLGEPGTRHNLVHPLGSIEITTRHGRGLGGAENMAERDVAQLRRRPERVQSRAEGWIMGAKS